ncbi:hypothetical protein HYT18_00265 [Candidatus Microgenomates bacterium]|nr:hypothetical protein [Candidatus Microgenomates bacterium]
MKFSIVLLLFFTFSFLFRTDQSFDQDLGRHIKLGEIIIRTGQVPKTNLFSYTNGDFPFINTHWLFEVLAYIFAQANALQALLILKIIVILVSVWITLKIIPPQNSALLLPIGFIFLHVLRERLELRPEIFSFLFTALTLFILTKFMDMKQTLDGRYKFVSYWPILILPLIQLIWINIHIYFFIGLILQAIFLIYTGYQYLRFHPKGVNIKLPLIIFILSVLISLLNPNGLQGLLYPLNVTKNYGYTIVENQTMFLLESINFKDPNFLFVKISVGIVILSMVFTLFSRAFDFKNILLTLTGVTLTLLNVRSFPYLVFLSLPATLQNFGVIKLKGLTLSLSLVACILLLFESYSYLNGDYYRFRDDPHKVGLEFEENVKGAVDFILANKLPQPIFNNFDIGSYIIYRGYPQYQVFVDGRPEAYPAQFFTGIYIPAQTDYDNFKEVEKFYGFKTIIFSHTDQTPWAKTFLSAVLKDEVWKLVYIDDFMVVLTKFEASEEKKLTTVNLSNLTPTSYSFDNHLSYLRLGIFLLNNQYPGGVQFVQKALQIFPNSPAANAIMANLTGQAIFWGKSKSKFFW